MNNKNIKKILFIVAFLCTVIFLSIILFQDANFDNPLILEGKADFTETISTTTNENCTETTFVPETTICTSAETVAIAEITEPIEEATVSSEDVEEEILMSNNLGVFELTAYCACYECCGEWSEFGLTATGTVPVEGRTIAVDPYVIPYGTEVIINGNTYIAEDCGGAIQGNRIDIFFDDHNAALEFGRQSAEVELVY